MPTTVQAQKLNFNNLPLSFLALCTDLFPNSNITAAILPLNILEHQKTENLHAWLHTKEKTQLKKFSLEKRSREWLGGRLCAKQSANTFFKSIQQSTIIPEYSQCHVQSEESGRPYFSSNTDSSIHFPELSISHSKAYAAAMSSLSCCGIDIQYSAKTLERVQEKFCTSTEDRILENLSSKLPLISRLTLLWSAKEAAKKMLSPGGIPGFHELELNNLKRHTNGDTILYFSMTGKIAPISVATTMFTKEYALAICCEKSDKKAY